MRIAGVLFEDTRFEKAIYDVQRQYRDQAPPIGKTWLVKFRQTFNRDVLTNYDLLKYIRNFHVFGLLSYYIR